MANKTKIQNSATRALKESATTAGLLMMTAATTLGLVEIPHFGEEKRHALVPAQPVFAFAGESQQDPNPIRRERDEIHPQHVGYGISQRTPGRTGRI